MNIIEDNYLYQLIYFKRLDEPEFKQVFMKILNEYNLGNETSLYNLWKIYKTIDTINYYGDLSLETVPEAIRTKKFICERKEGFYGIGKMKKWFRFYCPQPDELYMEDVLQQNLSEEEFIIELF